MEIKGKDPREGEPMPKCFKTLSVSGIKLAGCYNPSQNYESINRPSQILYTFRKKHLWNHQIKTVIGRMVLLFQVEVRPFEPLAMPKAKGIPRWDWLPWLSPDVATLKIPIISSLSGYECPLSSIATRPKKTHNCSPCGSMTAAIRVQTWPSELVGRYGWMCSWGYFTMFINPIK